MPHTHITLLSNLLLAVTSTKKTTTSPTGTILFLVVIVAAGYFLLIRPQKARARKARQVQSSIEVGDEVMLTSGIIGQVTWMENDRARVEIAPGTEIEVVKQALGRKVAPPVTSTYGEEEEEDGSGSASGGDDAQLPFAVAANNSSEEQASPVGNGTTPAPDSEDREGT